MGILRLTLRQLQIFVAVANSGSTSAASSEIALSQSATSAAVIELERVLSLTLFDRVGKRLILNDNGQTLLPKAQSLLDGAAQVEHMARDATAQLQAVRIGASTTIGSHVVPGLLTHFLDGRQQAADAWHSQIAIGNTTDICARVARYELDIGFIEGPCHEATLQVRPWLHDEMVIVAPCSSQYAEETISLHQLQDAVWLLREPGSGTREETDNALLRHLGVYRRSIELGSSEAIVHGVATGLGLACLSRWAADDSLRAGRIRLLRSTFSLPRRQWHWIMHRDKQITPALQKLTQLLTQSSHRN